MTRNIRQLGGFQDAAELLSALAEHRYSRQGVQQLYDRRDDNGFPDRKRSVIKGKAVEFFDLQEIADWYAFAEAAVVLTMIAGKQRNSKDVYALWRNREILGFPDRKRIRISLRIGEVYIEYRLAFDFDEMADWHESRQKRTVRVSG